MSHWVILGCGFIGTRLARALLADGESVLCCSRDKNKLAELEKGGADALVFEATIARAFQHGMVTVKRPVVVYCLPPMPGFPGGEIVSRAASAALAAGAERFVYLSSTAVYGEARDNASVDEDTPTVFSDPDARPYLSAEGAIDNARRNGLDSIILRLSPVYGPGRGVRERLLGGTYRLLDEGEHVYSRIHVDDVVGVIRRAVDKAPVNATYCLADDRPCPQKEYANWLSEHLGTKPPTSVPSLAPGMPRRRVRNRAVSNAQLKDQLGYVFRYPTYREGELAIDKETGVEGKEATLAPLVIHKRDKLDAIADGTGFRRLSLVTRDLAAKSEERLDSAGETMVCVIAGEVEVMHGDQTHKLAVGDMVEVPMLGLQVKAGEKGAARLLLISAPF